MTRDKATIGRILKDHGYWTACPARTTTPLEFQVSQAGPFEQWPTGVGVDYFYGFVGGDANHCQPNLFPNTTGIYQGNKPTHTKPSEPRYGSRRIRITWTMLNICVLAPVSNSSEITSTAVMPPFLRSIPTT
jgi:arylsulfatase A-like enzyme